MLPQFGYIVAQAGADSRPSPAQSIYSAAGSASGAVTTPTTAMTHAPSPPTLQQKQPLTHATYTSNTSSHAQQRHQNVPYQHPPPIPSSHQQQQQPLYPAYSATGSHPSWMYSTSSSINGSTKTEYHTQYYSSNYDPGYTAPSTVAAPPSLPPPPPPPPAKASPRLPPASSTSSIWRKKTMSPMLEHVKPPPTSRWHQEDPFELNDSKMVRRLRDCNDVMAWMDHDFKEQRDEMYHEKRLALQNELKCIQEGAHAVFQEQVADLELERDQTIASAECFATYQQTMANQDLEVDRMVIEEEYKDEKRHLNDTIMYVLEDYRKQIKDDRGEVDIGSLFDQVSDRLQQKKQFRKRTTAMINGGVGGSGGNGGGTTRQETSSRGRRLKNATVTAHNINASMSLQEEEDVEAEYLDMKGGIAKRNTTISRR